MPVILSRFLITLHVRALFLTELQHCSVFQIDSHSAELPTVVVPLDTDYSTRDVLIRFMEVNPSVC